MARVHHVFKPSDYPGDLDERGRSDLAAFFDHLFPRGEPGEPHAGYAILAQSPRIALQIAKLADSIIYDAEWTQRRDLREIAIQALNLHFKCDFSFHAHLDIAKVAGITLEQQAALPYWRTSSLFDDEQRLVIEYTLACAAADVPAELFSRVVQAYGEKCAVEFTVAVGWWSLWAMLLNATAAEFQPERAQPLPKDYASELGGGKTD